jgi:uncharacterized protein (DUF1501 family)
MKRREFMKRSMLASVATSAGLGVGFPLSSMAASCELENRARTLVNVMLYGGMDSRFLFMPSPAHYSTNYLDKIWNARKILYPANYPDYASMFENEYLTATDDHGFEFGIFKRCAWLKTQFEQNNVALVANSFCSTNRRHDQSQLNANIGEPGFGSLLYDRDGWGGRLQEQLSTGSNLVELSHEISLFGSGSTAGERLARVIHAKNMRDIALPNVDTGSVTSRRNIMARALKSYYEGRGVEVADQTNSPFNIFFQHSAAFRDFGDKVDSRLNDCALSGFELPAEVAGLDLYSGHFEQQCKNLYDIALMDEASINTQVLSMRYDSWDTHNDQIDRIGDNLDDLFGLSGGLATTMNAMDLLSSDAAEKMVFNFSSDFGRQIIANGNRGTDHGRGLYTVLLGKEVQGGVYGEMFPEREALEDGSGRIPLETSGSDVAGLTSTEHVQAALCEWVKPGSASAVFPSAGSAAIEQAGMLSGLLPA